MQTMAARGLPASGMTGQAILQAALEAALPIAQADANVFAQFEVQNLSNRQQVAMFGAQQRANFLELEFNQDFQMRVSNAARIADIANINFSADQQIALENSRMAQTVDLANLNNRQAKVMADAAALTNLDMAELNNRQQAAVLNAHQKNSSRLEMFVRNVKSGDSTNIEAQAARTYWPLLMGSDFKRDQQKMGINSLLNYGYTILRATVARSIIASGLHPSVGVHHSNRVNSFVLADDLVEPFRPLVDYIVRSLIANGESDLSGTVKRELTKVLEYNLNVNNTQSSVLSTIQYLCNSLAHSFSIKKANLSLFTIPTAMELSLLNTTHVSE